jgi:hypothetical protein
MSKIGRMHHIYSKREVLSLKKSLSLILSFGIMTGAVSAYGASGTTAAADSKPQILDIAGKNTFVLSDGSMWSMIDGYRLIHTPGNFAQIAAENEDEYNGTGVTQDGKRIEWSISEAPHAVDGQSGFKQAAGPYWLKNDGTVWTEAGRVRNLEGVALIGYGNRKLGALTRNGDVLIESPNEIGAFKSMGTAPNASSVKAIVVYDEKVALLYDSGEVVVYELSNFDDDGRILPVSVAHDAVHIAYAPGDPTDILLVARKDGTVWRTGDYQDRWKLTDQVQGLSGIVKTVPLQDSEHFFAMREDGTWVEYQGGSVKSFDVPAVNQLGVSLSDTKPYVGDVLSVDILETYTNGAKIKVPTGKAAITIQKPHLLQLQKNGTLKVLGVGQTEVTVTSSGVTKTLTVSASLRNSLKYSKIVQGVVYVPAKAVLQAMGGTVTASGSGFDVKVGGTALSFRAGDANAKLNGQAIRLKAAPLSDKGGTLIPASLLTDAFGAKVQWDGKWKQANIRFGDAKMTVVSAETAALVKKAAQGSLAKFIGKTYWVNVFENWERFSKVTVTDIVPQDTGDFVFVFRSGSGQTLKSYPMSSSFASTLLTDGSNFLNYDPYKKYQWSASVWKQIKAGQVSLGMTKEQVRLSWGSPSGKSVTTAGGKTIETWVYANFDTVAFVNGKAAFVMS